MAKATKTAEKKKSVKTADPLKRKRQLKQYKALLGVLMILFSIALLLAFISFYIYGKADQSAVAALADRTEKTGNWLGKFGAWLADLFIYRGFGAASFLFVKLFFVTGAFLLFDITLRKIKNTWFWDLFAIILISIALGFLPIVCLNLVVLSDMKSTNSVKIISVKVAQCSYYCLLL